MELLDTLKVVLVSWLATLPKVMILIDLVKSNSTQFERLNVLYNIGSLYSHIAFKQPLKDTNGIKMAYNYFQVCQNSFISLSLTLSRNQQGVLGI